MAIDKTDVTGQGSNGEDEKITVNRDRETGYTRVHPGKRAGDEYSYLPAIILRAIQYSKAKHGELTKDPVRALGIVTEELGEAMDEALCITNSKASDEARTAAIRDCQIEIAQMVGTACLLLVNLRTANLETMKKYDRRD